MRKNNLFPADCKIVFQIYWGRLKIPVFDSSKPGNDGRLLRAKLQEKAHTGFGITLYGLFIICISLSAEGQDRVVIQTETGTKTFDAAVQRFDGKDGLLFQTRGAATEKVNVDHVLEISPTRTESHARADQAFEQKKHDAALLLYQDEINRESRPWVRQLLLSMCVRCFRALGKQDEAQTAFYQLSKVDPLTPYLTSIPLKWCVSQTLSPIGVSREEQLALQWIDPVNPASENPTASLLAASVLLGSSQQTNRTKAINRLQLLSFIGKTNGSTPESKNETQNESKQPSDKSSNEMMMRNQIAILAVFQLRRIKLVEVKTESELTHWLPSIESLMKPLRIGPYRVLGDGYAQIQQGDKAVLYWLHAAIPDPEDRPLAAQSLSDAAKMFRKMGRDTEVRTLYEEIVRDYSDLSPYAQDAAMELKK